MKKDSVFRLSSATVLVIVNISHLNNFQDILSVKADNGNDKCQKIKNECTCIKDEKIKLDECDASIDGSEKCDSVTSFLSYRGNIKCS